MVSRFKIAMKYNTNKEIIKLQGGKSIPDKYGNVSEIAQYNLENGTHFYTIDQVEQHKKESNPGFLSKLAQTTVKVPVTPGVSTSVATSLQNIPKVESTVGQELGYTIGLLTSPMLLSEIGTYGPLVGGLRLAAGSAGAAGGSYVVGKVGDFADKMIGTNWIGDTGRLLGGFAGFGAGTKSTTPLIRSAAGKGLTLHMPQNTFTNLRGHYFNNAASKINHRGPLRYAIKYDLPSNGNFGVSEYKAIDALSGKEVGKLGTMQNLEHLGDRIFARTTSPQYVDNINGSDGNHGISRTLYNAALNDRPSGLISGESLREPVKTEAVWEHFPYKVIRYNGIRPEGKTGRVVNLRKQETFVPILDKSALKIEFPFFKEIDPQTAATTYHFDGRVPMSKSISEAEKLGIPKGERNQIVKPNPNAGAESQIDTYAINRAYDPWEIKDGKFVFKMGEPIATRGDYSEVKTPVTFHFTTDTQVKPHSGMDSWANAKTTYMVPWKSIVKYNGQPANIEPMDTWWTAGSTFEFPTKDVKVLTADPKTYRQYKLQGVDVEFSPEGRKSIQEGTGMREIVEDWIRKVQDETGMRPTTDTYRLMEQETGLRSGVTGKKVQSPWSSFIQEETNIPEYYHAPPTHSNSWSADSMIPIHWFGDKEVQNSNFINSLVKNVANDLDDYGTFTEKDLPALQKLVQNNKVFDKQLPITYGRYGQYRYNYTGKEELVDKINRILRGEIVIPYKQGGVLKGQNETLTFEEWYKTIPKEYNDTTNYNLRRAYQLVPFKDLEKWRKNPEKNHLNSVYKDENGDYEFLKLPGHPTLNLELDWYNKADKFKKKYQLDTTSIPWKYVHINKESQPN